MAWLDREEAEARRPRDTDGVPADVAVRYLRELATTCRKADGGPGRRLVAEALFEGIDALGFGEATLRLTDTAIGHGFAAVIPARLELIGHGRGERSHAAATELNVPALPLRIELNGHAEWRRTALAFASAWSSRFSGCVSRSRVELVRLQSAKSGRTPPDAPLPGHGGDSSGHTPVSSPSSHAARTHRALLRRTIGRTRGGVDVRSPNLVVWTVPSQ